MYLNNKFTEKVHLKKFFWPDIAINLNNPEKRLIFAKTFF